MTCVSRRAWRSSLTFCTATVSGLVAVPGIYLAMATATAIAVARSASADPGDNAISSVDVHRFVVLVPAHDEAAVIAATVDALLAQQYPSDRFEIHVVADNCSDDTASIAGSSGAEVHVRDVLDDPGKGSALNWLFDRVDSSRVDLVAIVDADTIVDERFLAALNAAFVDGAVAAQGFYGVQDPEASPAIALRYAALACRHHLRSTARLAWGCSCGLFGNGMAFEARLLRARRWSGHLIEDAEFQNELLLDGIKVTYVAEALLRAEMPESLDAADSQNERWELGRLQVARKYLGPLFKGFVSGEPLRRRVYADAIADHLVPPLSVVAAANVVACAVAGASVALAPRRGTVLSALVASAASLTLAVHVLVGLRLVHAPRSVYLALLDAPRVIVWKLRLLGRVLVRPEVVTWSRTARNNQVADDLRKDLEQ